MQATATQLKAYKLTYKVTPAHWHTKSLGAFFAESTTKAFARARTIVADETGGYGVLVEVFEVDDPRGNQ